MFIYFITILNSQWFLASPPITLFPSTVGCKYYRKGCQKLTLGQTFGAPCRDHCYEFWGSRRDPATNKVTHFRLANGAEKEATSRCTINVDTIVESKVDYSSDGGTLHKGSNENRETLKRSVIKKRKSKSQDKANQKISTPSFYLQKRRVLKAHNLSLTN